MDEGNDWRAFNALPMDRQEILLLWIQQNLAPIKSFNHKHTSYGLKHWIDLGPNQDSYFTNGQFKGAMLKAGYQVENRNALNWVFNISERSPIIQAKKHPK